MPTITIRIDVPEGASVRTEATTIIPEEGPDEALSPEAATITSEVSPEDVARYWRSYLSNNGRELYGAAASIQLEAGVGFTLNDVAERMGREYSSTQSIHRTTGRSARRWKDDTGTEAPIRLEWIEYTWDDDEAGMRTSYRLPNGVAEQIATF